jgi:hypothetical protein
MLLNTARRLAAAAALVVMAAPVAHAQASSTATQTVTYAVNAINRIAFTGTPSLTITTATAGSAPTSVTDASIPAALATGLTLSSSLAAPAAATSAGFLALGTTAVDLVTGITKLAQGSLGVSYKLDATAAAGVVTSASVVVTYTITGGT